MESDNDPATRRADALVRVKQNGLRLQFLDENCKSDRDIVLAAVQENWSALRFAAEGCRSDREIVLAAVEKNGFALEFATGACTADREIVLRAVKPLENEQKLGLESIVDDLRRGLAILRGSALQYAAEDCKKDREIVLAAVQQHGRALEYAAEAFKADREIVLAAVEQTITALDFASEALLLDSTFATEAKGLCYILKVGLLSGRYCYGVVTADYANFTAEDALRWWCGQLQLHRAGTEALVYETQIVPASSSILDWPGIRPLGEVSEYQLVVGHQQM